MSGAETDTGVMEELRAEVAEALGNVFVGRSLRLLAAPVCGQLRARGLNLLDFRPCCVNDGC